jgi:hypothetical protein
VARGAPDLIAVVVVLDQPGPWAGETIVSRDNKGLLIMATKTAARAMAVALLAGTASFTVPAAAQNAPMPPRHAQISSTHAKRLSAVAEYDAGLRRGAANSSRNAYLRGFSDGTSSEAYSARGYVVNSQSEYQFPSVSGYSSYDGNAAYYPRAGGYSSNDGRYVSYDNANGYVTGGYDAGYAPRGLMDVVVAPAETAQASDARLALWNYCAARYRSFDPASGTFLSDDGNRYFCR